MTFDPRALSTAAMGALLLDTHPWLSCDDCFRLLDTHAEALQAGTPVDPALAVHLAGCPACADEAAGLLSLLDSDPLRPTVQ